MSTNIDGKKLSELRKRFLITQACVYSACNLLSEDGNESDAEALTYAFSEFRKELEEDLPGITPNSMPEPGYKLN